jgi:ubiquinone/menaquinone biosynthesis C-methylase UbiE
MPTVQELYERWADDQEVRDALARSLEPRGPDWLFDLFADLGPRPGDTVLDAGARDARHTIRLVRDYGVRAVALDVVPRHAELAREAVQEAGLGESIEVVQASLESMPLADASFDWIWCRDVLGHVDVAEALAECARVLRPGGQMLAYVTLPTERLEPREAGELVRAVALTANGFDPVHLENAAENAGLSARAVHRLGSEWRERMIEDGTWNPAEDLLALARLNRRREELEGRFGAAAVDAAAWNLTWGIYQLLGKLCPTVYVWERRA